MSNKNAAIVEISQTANKFRSSIVLQYDNKYIDVKSILGLFTTLTDSSKFELHVHGPDAEEAKAAVAEVFSKHGLTVNVVE
jgi:phosphocarrier protein HPr